MSWLGAAFVAVNALALLLLPRKWALVPLLVGACYMTLGQGIEIGPLSFTVVRILIAVGVCRVVVRREAIVGGLTTPDGLVLAWAGWAVASGVFHDPLRETLVFRLGLLYNACGVYFLARVFCVSWDDVVRLWRMIALLLVPIAGAMLYEQVAAYNVFSVLGGVEAVPEIREGRLRASGPFLHPILAGTVGAVTLPLMVGLWRYRRGSAFVGGLACLTIVGASASSGPLLSATVGLGAMSLWSLRSRMRWVRRAVVCAYLGLELVMQAPAYYLLARIDLVGGSTGWHRARLIESSMMHFDEWWFAGTDYTRHWMPTGLIISPNHTDITNHYIYMGVLGGLPLMLLLIAILAVALRQVGQIALAHGVPLQARFISWAAGASVAAHAATWLSVSYFDQSVVFVYLVLAVVASTQRLVYTSAPERVRLPLVASHDRQLSANGRATLRWRRFGWKGGAGPASLNQSQVRGGGR